MADGKTPGRPPERVRVRLHLRARGIDESREMLWPKNWPLPTPNDRVAYDGLGGFVAYLDYDLDKSVVVIALR